MEIVMKIQFKKIGSAGYASLFILFLLISIYLLGSNASAQTDSIAVKVPYKQTFKIESTTDNVNNVFRYGLKAADDKSPMPEGSNDVYYFTVTGNESDILNLNIAFERPGVYSYTVKSYIENPDKNYTYEKLLW